MTHWQDQLEELLAEWRSAGRPNDGSHPYAERMSELVESFPCLRGRLPSRPWNVCAFAEAALTEGLSHGERLAANFVLNVWNQNFPCPPFDFFEAWATWDPGNREAFLRWAAEPWWP